MSEWRIVVSGTERSLERAFREGSIDHEELVALTDRSASLRGELRAAHLSAHLRMMNILIPRQRHRYQQLRGYAEGQGHRHHGQGDGNRSLNGSEGAPAATEPGGSPGPSAGFTGQIKPVLYVDDVETAAPFYSDVLGLDFLGFTDLDGDPYYAEIAAGPQKIGLHEPMTDDQERWVGHQRLYLGVRDLDVQRARLVEAGVNPSEIVETAWMDYFLVRDPSGHEMAFAVTEPERHEVDPWTRF